MSALAAALVQTAALLEAWGRPGAFVGGVAFVGRVRPRYTDDIDVAVMVSADELGAFADLAERQGFRFGDDDRAFFFEAGLLPMTSPAGVHVDVMVADDPLLESAVARATLVDVGAGSIPLVTAEDLLLLKLDAYRLGDQEDAIAIKDGVGDALDRAYLKRMAVQLGLLERTENLLGKL